MPNMLAHLGVGGVATSCVVRAAETRWILLGCLIPDLPWVFQRMNGAVPFELDPYSARSYFVVQASLAGCLWLAIGIALLTSHSFRVFTILALNILLHLFLDACQTKWGNGVHLLAPLSWTDLNWELFWPESALTYALTVFGLVYVLIELFRSKTEVNLRMPPRGRIGGALLCAVGYFVFPLGFAGTAEQHDVHFVRTMRDLGSRPGASVAIDRVRFLRRDSGDVLRTYAEEELRAVGETPNDSAVVSIRGRFIDSGTIEVSEWHAHHGRLRDYASLAGLVAIGLYWLTVLRWPKTARRQIDGAGVEVVRRESCR